MGTIARSADVAASEAGDTERGRPGGKGRERGEGQHAQVGRGIRRDVLERREVRDPLREIEELPEHPDDEAEGEVRPRERGRSGYEAEQRGRHPDRQPHRGKKREAGDDRTRDRPRIAGGGRGEGTEREAFEQQDEGGAAERDGEVTRREPGARHRRRQHLLGVRRRLLAPRPERRLDREPRGDEREDPERHRDVLLGEGAVALRGDDVGERLVVLHELVDRVGDPAVRDCEHEQSAGPADEAAALQPRRETERCAERRRRARAGRDAARRVRRRGRAGATATIASHAQQRGRADDDEQRPPRLAGERAHLLRPADR